MVIQCVAPLTARRPVAFQQRRLLGAESADAGGVLGHVGVQDASANALVGDDGRIE